MEKYSPFSLFIRQALLYPLASPFLPAEADVKKDVSYANGAKLGTYEAGGPQREWQTDPNMTMEWANAEIYAEYLEIDGATVSENPQNIWELATAEETMRAIFESKFDGGTGAPGGFAVETEYWSGTEDMEGYALCAIGTTYQWGYFSSAKTNQYNVRVVKI